MKHILIVEDDTTFAVMLQTWLSKKKFSVASVSGIAAAKKTLIESSVDLVLCDLRLPDGDGIDLLEWVSNRSVNVPLIVMTSYAAIPSAVQAMKLGARDYISKPVNPEDLLQKINEVFNAGVKTGKQIPVSESVPEETNYLEGQSEAARQLYTYVKLVAPTSMSVLINGASGTGKEYVAKRIHQLSKRSEKPFVAIDCGAIPKELAASEFFGHKKGSFTGAIEDKVGAFIEADGGTIFLDEIGNLSYDVQVQLLRVLQERRVKPIGTTTEVKVDVRLIAATNEDLKAAIKSGAFREDLYHRINEFTIYMPHLCERGEDIPLFANFFLDQANRELEKPVPGFLPEAMERISQYTWPGNLREMRNTVMRAALLAQGNPIRVEHLGIDMNIDKSINILHDPDSERTKIVSALQKCSGNKSKAAAMLGIDRKTLYNKLKLYQIE
ncbi:MULTISPECIES: sigma-54-dependent transcriptional regulator [Barnesiella]|jgi:two-component system response regulator HydG|uniref:sigma-54-dependent transcriptional regulator n=1 Tax=Barnesiella TaxID=397864 RepID=UPI00202E68B6|nr:sigma-54 dependent transcriptional regulator [Barnesiella sp. B2-R-119]MCM0688093.1 sigma-54 dependent transcriptional regulator [Barnesiella sp. B2-R-119]